MTQKAKTRPTSKHYKKKTCRVFSMRLDASGQEDIVIYQALYPTDYESLSRPLTERNEQVASYNGTGLIPRFRKWVRLYSKTNGIKLRQVRPGGDRYLRSFF